VAACSFGINSNSALEKGELEPRRRKCRLLPYMLPKLAVKVLDSESECVRAASDVVWAKRTREDGETCHQKLPPMVDLQTERG
jgi:hypothetical protein